MIREQERIELLFEWQKKINDELDRLDLSDLSIIDITKLPEQTEKQIASELKGIIAYTGESVNLFDDDILQETIKL